MAKRLRKGEKLDLILSELSQIKADIAKLLKRRSKDADATPRARRSVRVKTAKRAPAKVRAKAKAGAKPVLVEVLQAEQPREASQGA
jgi:hypothetical protein